MTALGRRGSWVGMDAFSAGWCFLVGVRKKLCCYIVSLNFGKTFGPLPTAHVLLATPPLGSFYHFTCIFDIPLTCETLSKQSRGDRCHGYHSNFSASWCCFCWTKRQPPHCPPDTRFGTMKATFIATSKNYSKLLLEKNITNKKVTHGNWSAVTGSNFVKFFTTERRARTLWYLINGPNLFSDCLTK